MKIVHVISGLGSGGAEMMLYRLLGAWDCRNDDIEVVSLTDRGIFGEKIEQLGFRVHALAMARGRPSLRGVVRLRRWLRNGSPRLIQCWMYHADLIGGLAAKLAGNARVVWGIHNSVLDPRRSKRTTIWTAKSCAWLSHWLPERIVCCSRAALRIHQAMGYEAAKMVVIPNGFDLSAFRPDPDARASVRSELGISPEVVVIGLSARFDPQKDHQNFVRAAELAKNDGTDAFFLLCGAGASWDNAELAGWIKSSGLEERFRLLGRREDMSRITAALDIATSSSCYGEAFPLVVGEAMSCGVPCVVTDIGDSGFIVGDAGLVVPPKNPRALADAWRELIRMGRVERSEWGRKARQRIKEHFELGAVAAHYERLYREVAPNRHPEELSDHSCPPSRRR